jgi:hypothetical protein
MKFPERYHYTCRTYKLANQGNKRKILFENFFDKKQKFYTSAAHAALAISANKESSENSYLSVGIVCLSFSN